MTPGSGAEALQWAAQHDVQLVLTDQRIPQMTGTELPHRMCDIFKFMTKPWDDDQLRANIRDAFTHWEAVSVKNKSVAAQVGDPL